MKHLLRLIHFAWKIVDSFILISVRQTAHWQLTLLTDELFIFWHSGKLIRGPLSNPPIDVEASFGAKS